MPFSDLLRDLDRGAVSEVVVNGDTLTFKLTSGQTLQTNAPANYVTANPAFIPDLAKRNVRIDVRTAPEQTAYSYGALILGVTFLGLLGFTMYRVTTGRIPALESKTRTADPEATTVTFADVAGVDEAKEEVKEIVDFLREPSRFSAIGGRIPKGRAARRAAGHRQDAAGAIDRRRSEGAVPVRERLGLRRDVCRRRRVAHPQAVQGRAPSPVVHHLHRRARRRGPEPRRQLAQPRRARADAQSAPRRDGRLRAQPGHRRGRRDQSPGHPRSGAAAPRALRSAGDRRRARREGPRADSAHPRPEGGARSRGRSAADRARHARVSRAPTWRI